MHNMMMHSHLLGKTNTVTLNVPSLPSFPPSFYCWSWCYVIRSIPLVSWDQLYCFSAYCATSTSSLAGQCETQKSLWLCVSSAQQQLKHQFVNTVFITNPRHSTTQASRKKISFILTHIRTPLNIRKHFFTVQMTERWHRIARRGCGVSPSIEIFKNHLDRGLGKWL